jgi:hypothetical protein
LIPASPAGGFAQFFIKKKWHTAYTQARSNVHRTFAVIRFSSRKNEWQRKKKERSTVHNIV